MFYRITCTSRTKYTPKTFIKLGTKLHITIFYIYGTVCLPITNTNMNLYRYVYQ